MCFTHHKVGKEMFSSVITPKIIFRKKNGSKQFKVDRLQMIVVAKKKIYICVATYIFFGGEAKKD